jgi:hypothetical protein
MKLLIPFSSFSTPKILYLHYLHYATYFELVVPAIAYPRKHVERPLMFQTVSPALSPKVLDIKKGTRKVAVIKWPASTDHGCTETALS